MVILVKKILIAFLFLGITTFTYAAELLPSSSATVNRIEWHAPNSIQNRFKFYFEELVGKSWDPVVLKIKIDQINKEIFQSGYLTAVTHNSLKGTADKVTVVLTIDAGERTSFDFRGNAIFSRQEIQSKLMDRIKNDFGKTDSKLMSTFIIEEYEAVGYYNTHVKVSYLLGRSVDGTRVRNYFFQIEEGEKLPVKKVSLRGAYHLSEDEVSQLLARTGTGLAVNKFYDKTFYENFSDIIKKEYLRRGFPFAEVSFPHLLNQEDEEGMDIEYSVTEKQRVILNKITITQITGEEQEKIKALLANHAGTPLNILELEKDLKSIVTQLQNQGYYFATISNLNSNTLLVYDKTLTSAVLNVELVTDRKVCFNDTIVNGNIKTKGEVVYREVNLERGELITPDKLEEVKHKITNLGLFSTTKITPYMLFDGSVTTCAKTNLVIQVKERDFGMVELAPGYRTDLGKKLSTNVIYNNFMGMNRSLSFKAQVNQRDNLAGFDERRRQENRKMWEYSLKASGTEPYVFYDLLKTQLEFELSASMQRKRFTGFDADIKRISPQFSKNFNKNISSSVKYQFEKINQFNATLLKDNDNFFIGGVTVSAAYDLRDDPVNSKRGPYFSLSSEWANPYFGSMKNNELEVNFVKLISRNKYYYTLSDFTLAFSLGMGMEKNYAQKGYIPSIKVFRLDGYDEIRGYDEGEINHLINGQAIGDVTVDHTAYFSAFKFEPRYNVTDNVQVDIFYDSGRVSVNSFEPFNLRSSAGVGFKFLTAVGALDFSYGWKLQKKTYLGGASDTVGRFHLSIGYF